MQTCPALKVLAQRIRSAAVLTGKSGATIAGDLPPSSSVTGVRLRAAFAITARPVAPEPVNSKWSKGREEKAAPRPPPSSKKASFVWGKYLGAVSSRSLARRREFSDILTIARFPAAKMLTSGEKLSCSGKFHGTMTPTTPSGCGTTRFRARGKVIQSTLRRRGFIQLLRRRLASWIAACTWKTSANSVSNSLRLP
jgi:hypothetical protein